MNHDNNNIYFIGAGGIGMAALERYYLSRGYRVAGYDRSRTPLTTDLEHEGVAISYDDDAATVPEAFRNAATTQVVYTPAVPADSAIMQYFSNGGFKMLKRAAVLGNITREAKALCFAGTHGKTTTSAMAAHMLHSTPVGCNAFLGGVLLRYGTNFMLSATSPFTVAEADEFDRSFHQLTPYVAVITATDPDHLDIYGTEEAYLESFAHFTELIRPGGALIVHTGLKLKPRPADGVTTYTYSRHEGDFHADNIRVGGGTIIFDFIYPGGVCRDIELGVPVDINIDNAIASLAACYVAVGEPMLAQCARAMATYPGVERRFQFHLKETTPHGRVIIDDYAHHPDELRQSIASVRALYPDRKLTAVFQPHLYTRTRDFAPQFAQALSQADEVILVDLYPAREKPIPGISSKTIYDLVNAPQKSMISKEEFVDTMKNRNFEILLTVGAGDLSFEVPKLCSALGVSKA